MMKTGAKNAARRAYRSVFELYMGEYQRELRRAARGCRTLLDIGCGPNSPLRGVARRMENSTGLDAFALAIEESRARKIHTTHILGDARKLDELFEPQSFDCVAATDLIEHLEKDEGFELLRAMERIARRRIIIFTPNGFLPQDSYGGNDFQRHRSGWSVDEMRGLDFEVRGINGWKPLRGERALVRRPRFLWEPVSFLSQPFVLRRPQHAFQLLCVKYL